MTSLEPGGAVNKCNDARSVKLLGEEIHSLDGTWVSKLHCRGHSVRLERKKKRYRCSPYTKSESQSLGGEEIAWKTSQ